MAFTAIPLPTDTQTLMFNVKDYNVQGNGVTDDTANIQKAINAAVTAGGGTVFFPQGTYLISVPLTLTSSGISLVGAGRYATTITPSASFSGVAAVVATGAPLGQIRDMGFQGLSSTYSANPAIDAIQVNHSSDFYLQDLYFNYWNGWCTELIGDVTGGSYFCSLINIRLGTVLQGHHIQSYHAGPGSGTYITGCQVGGTQNGDGLFIDACHDVTVTNLEGGSVAGGSTVHLKGDTGAVYFSNFDLGTLVAGAVTTVPTVLIESDGTYSPFQIGFTNGILEDGVYNLQVTAGNDINFSNVHFVRGGTYGVNISGATDRVTLAECSFIQSGYTAGSNNYDINWSSTGHIRVTNCTFSSPHGTLSGQVAQACNFTAGTSDIYNCSFLGASGSSAFAGFASKIRNCFGYNPVGAITPPTVPATGVASAAFSSDMTVYIAASGATITNISIGGTVTSTGFTSGTFRVPAGYKITMTYTGGPPTWTWFGD